MILLLVHLLVKWSIFFSVLLNSIFRLAGAQGLLAGAQGYKIKL